MRTHFLIHTWAAHALGGFWGVPSLYALEQATHEDPPVGHQLTAVSRARLAALLGCKTSNQRKTLFGAYRRNAVPIFEVV